MPTFTPDGETPADVIHFTYFVVRLQYAATAAAAGLSGIIERLASGEKRSFDSAEELIGLLDHWTQAHESPAEAPRPPRA